MKNIPLRIGLTGGIGSGKTTVSDLFNKLGAPVIDADVISHEVVQQGKPAYEKIIREFGADVIGDNGELRRDYLRQLIFDNVDYKERLEGIIHPYVREAIRKSVHEVTYPYCIISIPLLIESGLQGSVDRILVVDVPESVQLERASRRDNTESSDIMKIINSQIDRDERLSHADDIIKNDSDIEYLANLVRDMDVKYKSIVADSCESSQQ